MGVVAVLLLALLHGSTSRSTFAYASTDDRAVALVHSAIEKMGGEGNLRTVRYRYGKGVADALKIPLSDVPA